LKTGIPLKFKHPNGIAIFLRTNTGFKMSEQKELPFDFSDVDLWLANLGIQDIFLMNDVLQKAIIATANKFNISLDYANSLFKSTRFRYTDEEMPIAIFYHEYLRKIRDSHQ
jgi:hypothetical protein